MRAPGTPLAQPSGLRDAKRAMRARILAARDALSPQARAEADRRIANYLAQLPEYQDARTLLITLNFGSEVSTGLIGEMALASGKTLLAPRVNSATKMLDLYEIRDLAADLASGLWGIPEPRPLACRPASADEIDWVLVPGIAFDRFGGRLGYGGGYYDRLLPLLPPGVPNAAAAYSLQLVDRVPHGRHDLRIKTLVTDTGPVPIEPESMVPG